MILVSVVTTTHREVEWVTRAMGRIFPEQWRAFRDGVPPEDRDGNLAAGYARLLTTPTRRCAIAPPWPGVDWEDTHVATYPAPSTTTRYDDPRFRLCFARLVTHYWAACRVPRGWSAARQRCRPRGHPGRAHHRRLDISGPPDIAWELAERWPGAELVIVDDAGHGVGASHDRGSDRRSGDAVRG